MIHDGRKNVEIVINFLHTQAIQMVEEPNLYLRNHVPAYFIFSSAHPYRCAR